MIAVKLRIWYWFKWIRLSVRKKLSSLLAFNDSGYPFCHPFEQLSLSIRKKNVIHWNSLGYWFEENFLCQHCQPYYCSSESLLTELLVMNLSKNVSLNIFFHHLLNFHSTFSAELPSLL